MIKNAQTKPLKLQVSPSEERVKVLANEKWFVEYLNVDTRNALAEALELVDHPGDKIIYDGQVRHGFEVTYDNVLFLRESRKHGVFKFVAYHRAPTSKEWIKWKEGKKTAGEVLKHHNIKSPRTPF